MSILKAGFVASIPAAVCGYRRRAGWDYFDWLMRRTDR